MVKLPTSECGPDNRDVARALRYFAASNCRYLHHQLRVGTVVSDIVAARALAFQNSYCRRVFETQRIPLEQGYSTCIGLGGYSAIHWSLVESDRDASTERLARFMGAALVHRLRRAPETLLYRVLRGIPDGEPIHKEDCPPERRSGSDSGSGERCFGCL